MSFPDLDKTSRWVIAMAPIGVYALILPIVYHTGADLFTNL